MTNLPTALTLCALLSAASATSQKAGNDPGTSLLKELRPRVIQHVLPGSGAIQGLWAHEQTGDLTHDAVMLRGGDLYHIANLDGMVLNELLGSNVTAAVPLFGAHQGAVLGYSPTGSNLYYPYEPEYPSGPVNAPAPLTLNWGNVEEIKMVQRTPTSYAVVGKQVSSGTFHVALIDPNPNALSVINVPSFTVTGFASVIDWELGDKNNDGVVDVLVVGLNDSSELVVGGFLLSGAVLGSPIVLDATPNPAAPEAFVLATRRGADNEVTAVFRSDNQVTVTTVVNDANRYDFDTDWTASLPSVGADYPLHAVCAPALGDGEETALVIATPTADNSLLLQRTGSQYNASSQQLIKDGGYGTNDGKHMFAADSNNSRSLDIDSGDDYHTVYTWRGLQMLRMVTGINNAPWLSDAPQSQFSALWTTSDYTNFALEVEPLGTTADIRVAFNHDYFAALDVPAGATLGVEFIVWHHDLVNASFPNLDKPVNSQIHRWLIAPIAQQQLSTQGNMQNFRITLDGIIDTAGPRNTYYVEAKFYTHSGGEIVQRGPTHLFGYAPGDGATNPWFRQLRYVASSGASSEDELSENGTGNKSPGGIKKPNGFIPRPPIHPTSPPVFGPQAITLQGW